MLRRLLENAHHQMNYVEITVADIARAKKFYETAFQWKFTDYGPEYSGIQGGTGEAGGLSFEANYRGQTGGVLVILYF